MRTGPVLLNRDWKRPGVRAKRPFRVWASTSPTELGPGQSRDHSSRPRPDFGSSGMAVSRSGSGWTPSAGPGYINLGHVSEPLWAHVCEGVGAVDAFGTGRRATLRGARYFDSARSYGLAEAFLAGWLERRNLGPVRSASARSGRRHVRGGLASGRLGERGQGSVDRGFSSSAAESRELLGTYLCLYQIHSATLRRVACSRGIGPCSTSWYNCGPAGCRSGCDGYRSRASAEDHRAGP